MADTPNLKMAITLAANYVAATWQQVVMGTLQVPGARTPTANIGLRDIYAKSIIRSSRLVGQGGLEQSVISDKQIARDLENGKGPWDMKPMLLNGPKARVSKKGVKYNIIPFRHGTSASNTPNSNFRPMPKDIYQQARELKASVKSGKGMKWGGRLPATSTPGKNATTGYQHKHDIHEGMVRIEKKYAGSTSNKHMTFRIVSANSDPLSWWHPGYPAHHIAEGVTNYCRPAVEEMIRDAAKADLITAIGTIGVE